MTHTGYREPAETGGAPAARATARAHPGEHRPEHGTSTTTSGMARAVDRGSRTLSVAAVDPVPIFREGLHTIVEHTPGLRWSGYAASHHAAIQLCEQTKPDVVVLDSGFDPRCHLVRVLSETHPALVVLVLVGHGHRTTHYLAAAVAAGAHGLLPRAAEPRRFTDAVRRTYVERRHVDQALLPLMPSPGPVPAADRARMPLSRREYQVLQLIAEGMENSTVAETLFLSVETVRTHVKSILRKLSAHDRTHAVTKAFRAGILVLTPDETGQPAARVQD